MGRVMTALPSRQAIRRVYRVGVTGHRTFSSPTADLVRSACRQVLTDALAAHPSLVALSALAEGADTVFAEAALALGIPLEAVIPFDGYENDFTTPTARETYNHLLRSAKVIHRLHFRKRSDDAYLAAGRWIGQRSDLLVAIWDGEPSRGLGGTGDIVEMAQVQATATHIIPVTR